MPPSTGLCVRLRITSYPPPPRAHSVSTIEVFHGYPMATPPVVCFFTGAHGDWGGASRVIYTAIRRFDRSRLTPLVMLPEHGPIEAELDGLGIGHVQWGRLTEFGSPVQYVRTFVRALRLYRRHHVRAVHVNFAFWRPAEVLAARVLGIPVFAHYHLIARSPGPFMRMCKAIVAVSKFTADSSGPTGVEKEVIYNPIDLARFERGRDRRADFGCTSGEVVVSFMGQIREIKGVQDFVEMTKRSEGSNVRFRSAGEWQEPLGLIGLEAGACRKPIVTTRVGGIPEVVEDGVNGFLVPPADPQSLAARTAQLIADPVLRKEMGTRGYEKVAQDFTDRPVKQFEALLIDACR